MEPKYRPKMLKNPSWYFLKALKFYDIKVDYVAPLAFVLMLATNFLCNYSFVFTQDVLQIGMIDPKKLGEALKAISQTTFIKFVCTVLVNLFSCIYIYAYVKESKGESCSVKPAFLTVVKNLIKIILVYVTLYAVLPVLSVIYRLPVTSVLIVFPLFLPFAVGMIIVSIMLVFSSCYILDRGKSLTQAYEASSKLTKGHKLEIFSVILLFKFGSVVLSNALTYFILSFMPHNTGSLVVIFVYSFISSIFSLMEARIIALMYLDLEN